MHSYQEFVRESKRRSISVSYTHLIAGVPAQINIAEVRNPELDAKLVADSITSPVSYTHLALKALEGDAEWEAKILELAGFLDSYIPEPERAIDKPFLLPIEDVFSISGRSTVVTGRVERGIIKVGEEVEIVGIKETQKSTDR